MERPVLTKAQLMGLLMARYMGDDVGDQDPADALLDVVGPTLGPQAAMLRPLLRNMHVQIVELKADRMLQDPPPAFLFTEEDVRRHIRESLLLTTLELPPGLDAELATAGIELAEDFVVQMVFQMIHHEDAYERAWERIRVIHELADECGLEPIQFLNAVKESGDWILRRTSAPVIYRTQRLSFIEEIHPDKMRRRFGQFLQRFRTLMPAHEYEQMHQGVMAQLPDMEGYWRVRAMALQKIEQDIKRIWPEGMGET